MERTFLFSNQLEDAAPAVSAAFGEVILQNKILPTLEFGDVGPFLTVQVNSQYSVLYLPLLAWRFYSSDFTYYNIPKLFTFIDTVSLEEAGILSAQLQPFLNLRGEGVLLGFLDSGIDYTHPAFRGPDGRTRILRIWDQSARGGPSPDGIPYGTEYTREQINEALFSGNPYDIVPQRDELGHGTAVCGIACGSGDTEADFTGAAPDSSIAFVKLRPARDYLRDFFLTPEDADVYQETDLMLGVRYLTDLALELGMPLVICMTLGSNQGGHTGDTPLENVLVQAQFNAGIYAVTGTGNEAGQAHHYRGSADRAGEAVDVELLVDRETQGFTMELWADPNELYSVGFTSPLGESIQPVRPRSGYSQELGFILENSRIHLSYYLVELLSGAMLAQMRFRSPTPGLWRIRVENLTFMSGVFHMWLPITGLVDPGVSFYTPSPDTTLVIPSCAESLLTSSAYNAYNNSLYLRSGRGFTRNGLIKPDLAAPGVNLTVPRPGGGYGTLTGSCASSALTAGATALLAEASLRRPLPRVFTAREIKTLFLRGARQSSIYSYPNREWGYGTLDLYGVFESFLT